MQDTDRREILQLLHGPRLLTLAVLIDGEPYASAIPFALRPDLGAALVHASKLARHSRGLHEGAPFSVVIAAGEGKDGNPFEVPRITFTGQVAVLAKGGREWEKARATFLARLPEGEMMFSLGDFVLYELRFAHGRYVAGFARTINLSPESLAELAASAGDDGRQEA